MTSSLIARLTELGADATDSPEDRLRKKLLVSSAIGVALLASVWDCVYAAFGLWRSAAIPFTHQLLVVALVGWFARTRRLAAARSALLGMWLVLPFALQWSLGGFAASGIVMAWAVAAPFGSIPLHDARASLPWFAAFLALTVASGLADPWLALHGAPFSDPMRRLFTVMNVAGVAAVTFGLLQYAFRQREAMQAALEVKHKLLQAAEAALQRELSHQVTQRSRELGAALARGATPGDHVDVSPGAKLDSRYEIVRSLGEGGMGAVYEVRRITDGQSLALKLVSGPVSRANAQRFAREAEIGARLRHPNLVPIVDVGLAAGGAPFLVMELVRGVPLEERRSRFGDEKWALPILRQMARGLAALHSAKVVHRDLKPGNVLLSGDEGAPLARIADFGISRLNEAVIDASAPTAANLTGTNAMLGTPLYMAPELGRGHAANTGADVFAFGIVAYEMLTGRPPFAMPPVVLAMAGHELPAPATIAWSLVLRCLAADPDARPAAEELVELA